MRKPRVHTTETTDDLKQEARLIALEKGFDPEDANYIAGIVRNLQKHNTAYRGRLKEDLTWTGEIEIEDLDDMEIRLDVRRALKKMAPPDVRIAWYALVQGWSGMMIARKIGRSLHHVQDRMFIIKGWLREELEELK